MLRAGAFKQDFLRHTARAPDFRRARRMANRAARSGALQQFVPEFEHYFGHKVHFISKWYPPMLQPKKHRMMQTKIIMAENKSASPTRAPCVLPSLVPITMPHRIPPIPPPMSAMPGERLSLVACPGEVCLINKADSAVNTGGAIKPVQNQTHLILNCGTSGTDGGFIDGNSCPQ